MDSWSLETERFFIRPLEITDADGIFQLDSNPSVHRYLGNNPIKNKEEAERVIEFIQNQYEKVGIGRVAIIEKQTKEFVGWTGLKLITDTVNNLSGYYDLGYRLREEYWGMGVATETARACIKHAFENLKINEIYAICDVKNLGSKNVLLKCGFELVSDIDYEGIPHYWFALT
jgi:ribosomal-protein-alanine N-acetyltransferase